MSTSQNQLPRLPVVNAGLVLTGTAVSREPLRYRSVPENQFRFRDTNATRLVPDWFRLVPSTAQMTGTDGAPLRGGPRTSQEREQNERSTGTSRPVDPPPDDSRPSGKRSTATRELLGFPACWIARLPVATSMLWRPLSSAVCLLVSTSAARSEAARRRGDVVFVGRELDAVIAAAENDRTTASLLAQWCQYKRLQPTWVLTLDAALGGLLDVVKGSRGWTLERVLRAYAVELVGVAAGDDEPAVLA